VSSLSLLGRRGRDRRATALGAATSSSRTTTTAAAGAGLALEGRSASAGRAARLEAARATARRAPLALLLARLDEDLAVLDLDAALAALVGRERGENGPPSRGNRLKFEEGAGLGLDNLEVLDTAKAALERLAERIGVERRVAIGTRRGPVSELPYERGWSAAATKKTGLGQPQNRP